MNWQELLKAFNDALAAELAKIDLSTEEGKKAKRELLASATNPLQQDARQHVQDLGFGKSYKDHEKDKENWTKEKGQFESELAALRTSLDEAKKQQAQGDPKSTSRINELEAEITKLRAEMKTKGEEHAQAIAAERKNNALARLESTLTRLKGVDPLIARARVRDEDFLAKQVKLGQDGDIVFYTPDGLAPLAVPQGADPIDFLADQIMGGIDPKYIASGVKPGAGASGSGGTGSGANVVTKTVEAQAKARQSAYNPILAHRQALRQEKPS